MTASRIKVFKTPEEIVVSNDVFLVKLSKGTGGLPSYLGFGDGECVFSSREAVFSAKRRGEKVRPVINGEWDARVSRDPDGRRVSVMVEGVKWRGDSCGVLEDYRQSFLYEFWHDGAAYVKTFFYAETLEPQELEDFILELGIRGIGGRNCEWAHWRFPKQGYDAADIQSFDCYERFIPKGESRAWENEILPYFSFDFGKGERRDRHAEFFVECWNSLKGSHFNTETGVDWVGNTLRLRWNFQKTAVESPRAAYWRNTWGWALSRFPCARRRMPLRIFHYLDNFKRYPDNGQVRKIAAEDANLLILHENWRLDAKQGEFAYERRELSRVARACRRHGLRLALYVRGNEDDIVEDYGENLGEHLKYNYDGIYMDYGSPRSFTTFEDEEAPGGRMKMRMYDLKMRRVRDFVGPDGVLISHTGSFFCAVGQTSCDTYVGGEQERGRLLESRTLHSYFSGLSVAPASLWTAAFPPYRSEKALPFLSATAQAPFVHIGCQLPSSSLDHVHSPFAANFARPLWRLWKLFESQGPFRIFSDQNTEPGALGVRTRGTGACAYVNRNGDVLTIAGNFLEKKRRIRLRPDIRMLSGSNHEKVFELAPARKPHPGYAPAALPPPELSAETGGCEIAAWLFTSRPDRWRRKLDAFARPYPAPGSLERSFLEKVDDTRQKRLNPPEGKRLYLRVWLPDYPTTYEDSLHWDLYDNVVELADVSKAAPVRLGYVAAGGLKSRKPARKDYLWPGCCTPWIPLHGIRGLRGRRKLALKTRKGEHEFYSFVYAELSDKPRSMEEPHIMEFCNEVDKDWSSLEFFVNIPAGR